MQAAATFAEQLERASREHLSRQSTAPASWPRESGRSRPVLPASLDHMPYTSAEARQELVDAVAEAIEHIGFALADLGAAYEQLDEHNAGRLEAELFGP